jgi:UDP-N-acetylmuramate dehydrogenase
VDLREIVRWGRSNPEPFTAIGNGSNLLVRDGGLRGVVVKIAENLAAIRFDGSTCCAQAGALLAEVSRSAAAHTLGGLEFAIGIPGTIGGGAMMNAGAYGGELRDVVRRVLVIDETGEFRDLRADELEFGYRRSILQRRPWIVTEVEMELIPRVAELTLGQMSRNQFLRQSMQPLELPSAGSVFKRPPGRFVGPMIEELGLKGCRIGGAQVSEKHAGFIVNRSDASAADVLALIDQVRRLVSERFDVWLETEIRIIGDPAPAAGPRDPGSSAPGYGSGTGSGAAGAQRPASGRYSGGRSDATAS